MVPVSVRNDGQDGQLGNRVSSYFVDLPVGEGNPVMRLHQVSFAMRGHKESAGRRRRRDRLAVRLRAADAALAGRPRRLRLHPPAVQPGGHQRAGAAVPALRRGAGCWRCTRGAAWRRAGRLGRPDVVRRRVYFGLNADRDAMPDIDVLAGLIEESLAELVGTVTWHDLAYRTRPRRRRRARRCRGRSARSPRSQQERGLDPREPRCSIGTSAGSVLSAFLGCGVGVDVLLDHQRRHRQRRGARHQLRPRRRRGGAPAAAARPGIGSPRGVLSTVPPVEGDAHGRAVRGAAAGPRLAAPIGTLVTRCAPGCLGGATPQTWVVAMDYDSGRRVAFVATARRTPPCATP
jgi:hypothetical protein